MNADSLRSGDEHLKRASKAQLLALTNAIEWQSGIGRGDPQSIHHLGMRSEERRVGKECRL